MHLKSTVDREKFLASIPFMPFNIVSHLKWFSVQDLNRSLYSLFIWTRTSVTLFCIIACFDTCWSQWSLFYSHILYSAPQTILSKHREKGGTLKTIHHKQHPLLATSSWWPLQFFFTIATFAPTYNTLTNICLELLLPMPHISKSLI